MTGFKNICTTVKEKHGSDIHIFPEHPAFYRVDGKLERLDSFIFTEEQVKKIILDTSTPKARAILGRQRQVTYAENVEGVGRVRFSVFFDKGKFALSARLLSDSFYNFKDLGFNEPIKKIVAQPAGLILVGSPSGEGKTSTIASLLNFINLHFEKNIITIENPVEFIFEDNKSAFIQRSIPVDITNFYFGLCEAYRLDPDIVVTDSVNYPDAMDKSLSLCEAGCSVIGSTEGGDCLQILERLINLRKPEERDTLRVKLASQLNMVISQRLVPTLDGSGRKAIFDIMVNTAQMKALIKGNNLTMFRAIQEKGKASGMRTFDQQLIDMVSKRIISAKTAGEFATDKQKVNGLI